jgi:SpoVK/Ycf46/Vps4 family AAA+-type ATPase
MIQQEGSQISLSEDEVKELIQMTKGYSGADLKCLCTEAAMMPLRGVLDIENIDVN